VFVNTTPRHPEFSSGSNRLVSDAETRSA